MFFTASGKKLPKESLPCSILCEVRPNLNLSPLFW